MGRRLLKQYQMVCSSLNPIKIMGFLYRKTLFILCHFLISGQVGRAKKKCRFETCKKHIPASGNCVERVLSCFILSRSIPMSIHCGQDFHLHLCRGEEIAAMTFQVTLELICTMNSAQKIDIPRSAKGLRFRSEPR